MLDAGPRATEAVCSSVAAARAVTVGGPARLALATGQQAAFAVAAVFAVLGLVVTLVLPKIPARRAAAPTLT